MDLSATGEPVITGEDTQVDVGLDLQLGSLTLTLDGEDFEPHHALVKFASVQAGPWTAQEVKFSGTGPDGKSMGLPVDLLNDAYNGPRAGLPATVWKVVALAATSAGDIGITYAPPGRA